jgi:hypothetical protein
VVIRSIRVCQCWFTCVVLPLLRTGAASGFSAQMLACWLTSWRGHLFCEQGGKCSRSRSSLRVNISVVVPHRPTAHEAIALCSTRAAGKSNPEQSEGAGTPFVPTLTRRHEAEAASKARSGTGATHSASEHGEEQPFDAAEPRWHSP